MLDLVALILRMSAGVGSFVVLVAALTIDSSEQRRAQGVLEEWWLRVDGSQTRVLGRHWALVKVSAAKARNVLARVLGQNIYSYRGRGILTCVGGAGLTGVTSAWLTATGWGRGPLMSAGGMAALCAISLVIAVLIPRIRDQALLMTAATMGVLPFLLWMRAFTGGRWPAVFAVVLTLAASFGAVHLAERILAELAALEEPAVGTAVRAALLAFLPAASLAGAWLVVPFALEAEMSVSAIIIAVIGASLPVACLLGLFAAIVASLIVHRLVWLVLNRVVYALQLHDLPKKRGFLLGLGIAMLTAAVPTAKFAWVTNVIKSAIQ